MQQLSSQPTLTRAELAELDKKHYLHPTTPPTAIAEETGFDRKTISKYIKSDEQPKTKGKKKRESKLEAFKLYLL